MKNLRTVLVGWITLRVLCGDDIRGSLLELEGGAPEIKLDQSTFKPKKEIFRIDYVVKPTSVLKTHWSVLMMCSSLKSR